MSASSVFKQMVEERPLVSVMAAHNPLTARLVEEAGFEAIWASGFELSASLGIPDASIFTMTEQVENVRNMSGAIDIPIVADIDTGYGNAINVIHAIEAIEGAGAALAVMEDKNFPKDTSLLEGGRQDLLRIEEFQGKIEAAVAQRKDPDFMIVARIEALIAGQGQEEALKRGHAYEEAGADAILIHSKSKTPDEIVEFAKRWDGGVPIVIVPTVYPQLTEERIRELGNIKVVIYGNHCVRGIVTALRDVFSQIRADGGIEEVDKKIVSVEEIFDLQNVAGMKENEKRYLR